MKEKKQKTEKKISAGKLPGLLKKSYTKKDFDKKILKKLYVEEDKKLITSLFSEKEKVKGTEKIFIAKDRQFTKKEFKNLKTIAKSIKKNGGRFKLVPFAACAGFIAVLVITVCLFKNPVLKWIIVSGCEGVFGAKTDVASVNAELLGIDITVNGLAIGDKSSESGMKNLFVADKIQLSVSLSDALRGKFICDEISITGIDFGTDRTESCILPSKKSALADNAEDSEFMKSVRSRSENAVADVKSQIETMLGGSSADEIWANLQSQLKTQAAAEELKTKASELTAKWMGKPAEIKGELDSLQASVKEVQSINVNSVKDVAKLKSTLDTVSSALKKVEETKKSVSSVTGDLEKDKKSLEAAKKNMTDAVKSDMALAENIADTAMNAGSVMNGLMETAGYDMLGEYYPYAKMGIDYAVEWKKNAAAESKDAEKVKKSSDAKGSTSRLKGTTFWFGTEKPGLLIKKVTAEGKSTTDMKFDGKITDISSNQDYNNKPAVASLYLSKNGMVHDGRLTLDARTASKEPLITAKYSGSGFNASYNKDESAKGGIPVIQGKAKVSFTGKFDSAADMSGSGSVEVTPANGNPVMTSSGFGNEKFDRYYTAALEGVKKLDVGYKVGFSEEKGVDLSLSGNYSNILTDAFKNAASGAGADVQAQLREKIRERTDGYSSDALAKVTEFTGISTDVTASASSLSDIEKQLNSKKSELEKKIAGQTAGKAKSAAGNALKKFF